MTVRNSFKALKHTPGAQIVHRRGPVLVVNEHNPRMEARQR